jgi:hypothetical protein
MVFDPAAVPPFRPAFMDWYERTMEHEKELGYDGLDRISPGLRAWFLEMIAHYPPLDGPYASDVPDEEKFADYSITKSSIYMGFALSQAGTADETVLSLAEKHEVGFFDVSGVGGVWMPVASGEYKCVIPCELPRETRKKGPWTWRQFRLLFVTVLTLAAGPYMIGRDLLSAPPSFDDLEKVVGAVEFEEEARASGREHLVLVVGKSSNRFKYLEWFPKAEFLTFLIKPGEDCAVWTDRDREGWVWQIEQHGETLISYDDVRAAVCSNQRLDWLFGAILVLVGIFGAVALYRQRGCQSWREIFGVESHP